MSTTEPAMSSQGPAAQTRPGPWRELLLGPAAMAVLFVCVFAPLGLLLRLLGRDLLRLKRDPAAATYWIARDPPGPAPGSMSKQV
jgi:hypothetical protein